MKQAGLNKGDFNEDESFLIPEADEDFHF